MQFEVLSAGRSVKAGAWNDLGGEAMKPAILLRFSGAAAILAGAARVAAAAPLPLGALELEAFYQAIDMLLLFALMGIYLARAEALGWLGLAGFALAIGALSFIGGPDADPFGFSTYEQGAATLAIAMAGFSIAWLRGACKPIAPPFCWLGSVIAAGVLGALPQYGLAVAGALFGLGFVAAGLDLLQR